MLRTSFSVLPAAAVLFFSTYGDAATVFTANLTNDQENPPASPLTTTTGDPRPTSFGTATLVLNDAQTELTFIATVTNIDFTGTQTADTNDDLIAAHIHAGPDVTSTTNGGVVWGFFGTPFNETDPNDQVVTPFATGVGGVISGKWDLAEGNNTTLADQLDNIFNGRSYMNFHTPQFPSGEIRGAIEVIPLPPAMLSGLLGLGALGAMRCWSRLRRSGAA